MSRYALSLAVLMVVALQLCSRSAWGDGLIRRLPDDGAWARFYDVEEFSGDFVGGESSRVLWVTIKSVAQKSFNGQMCRWLEIKFQNEDPEVQGQGSVWKLLIPESQL